MKITPRYYQEEAVDKGLWALNKFKDNSLLVLPTAAGKSLVSSIIADKLNKEVLILQPSKEILEQNMLKLEQYVSKDEIGVYSASFKRKDINKYTFATIQSVYKKPELFKHIGQVVLDEADLLNPRNKKGMFTSFLKGIDNPQVLGLTATPYRNVNDYYKDEKGNLIQATSLKLINRMNPRFWNRIAYNINNQELFEKGYLSPLVYSPRTLVEQWKIPTNITMSDFDLDAYSKMLEPFEQQIVESIAKSRQYRKAVLVFCSSVNQAKRMATTLGDGEWISGETPMKERDRILNDFRLGKIKVIFNVGVLVVGFDYPELDTIFMIRPTRSLRLHYQMLGRGIRIAPNKEECVVVDFSGNYDILGAIEEIHLLQEGRTWELYANGKRKHGVPMYSSSEFRPNTKIKF